MLRIGKGCDIHTMVPQRRGLGGKAGRQEKAFSWAKGLSRGVAGPEEGKEV